MCLWYEHHYSLCICGHNSNEISTAQTISVRKGIYIKLSQWTDLLTYKPVAVNLMPCLPSALERSWSSKPWLQYHPIEFRYLAIIFCAIYGAVSIQLTHLSYIDYENTCTWSYFIIIKSKVWPICHCLGLGHETMVCAVCLQLHRFQFRNKVTMH